MLLKQLFLSLLTVFQHQGPKHSQQQEGFVPTPHGPQSAEEAVRAAEALHGNHYGGDMILSSGWNASDGGVKNEWFRWHGYPGRGVVPLKFHESVSSNPQYMGMIKQAIKAYETYTCIRFKNHEGEADFVYIYYGNGCFSNVGKTGGVQYLSLGRGCWFVGTVVHELGHAIGLAHEHQRSDRNNYITVYEQNVQQGQGHNFKREDPDTELKCTEYDYDSIMHYGNYAFSVQPGRMPTMVANNGQRLLEPYDKHQFTKYDLDLIKCLYKCFA